MNTLKLTNEYSGEFNTDIIEVRPNWFIRISPFEKTIEGLPVNPHIPAAIGGFMSSMMPVFSLVGTGMSVFGQLSAGRAAEQQGKAEQELSDYNARIQEAEGRARMEAAENEEEKISKQQKQFLATQRATMGKQGFSIEEGSNVEVLADSYGEFTRDRLTTLRNGMLQKIKYNSMANLERGYGAVAAARGKNLKRASYLNAAGTAMSGISNINWPTDNKLKDTLV